MDSMENGLRQSRIPHPRAAQAGSGLQEINEAQQNSRTQSSTMRIPAPTGAKRLGSELQPQPEAKRQTLAERAGEYNGKKSITGSAVAAASSASIRGSSIATLASKTTKLSRPTSSLIQPAQLSNARVSTVSSNSFLARSIGPSLGKRPGHTTASQTAATRQRPNLIQPRPATSVGQYTKTLQDEDQLLGGKQQNVLDVDERLREVESQFYNLKDVMSQSLTDRKSLEDVVELAKTRANDLERQRDALEEKVSGLRDESDSLRQQIQSTSVANETERREMKYKFEDQVRAHRRELEDERKCHHDALEELQRSHCEALEAMKKAHAAEREEEESRVLREMLDLKTKLGLEQQDMHSLLQGKDRELQSSKLSQAELRNDLEREQLMKHATQTRLAEAATVNVELEEKVRALQAQVDFLKSDSKQQSDQFAEMEARMQQALKLAEEARQKLIKEETERRILFNKYQELKGNIRVMCRVRPALGGTEPDEAKIAFPDANTSSSQIDVAGPEEKSSLGVVSRKTMPFEFDRVFAPNVRNEEVFDEISQLVQSALDGYNVCIFCYGQTGSGKTYTMSSPDGMIPRATHMIYDTVRHLEEKSWVYTMEGSFIEVYNEELHDLLSSASAGAEADAKKKLEIRHDDTRKTTTVTNCKSVRLDSADTVESMLCEAQSNRSVAATKSNERSSRSHSVFMLKLVGENRATRERCEGTLNLVDLAGSERLKQSGAEGDRKRETQSINKSLACLGDVIEALGRGAPHIPYRNSKLTHLLQYSLGGNSKTLMFVMVSPLEAHLKETLTSLRFATKVHNTHIGTAKSTKKTKD